MAGVGNLAAGKRRFQIILIKPSHYDDDGYVVQWRRAFIPSNSLAVVHSIARDSARRMVLGPDVEFDFLVIDESNTRVDIPYITSRFKRRGAFGLVALVGVQSNQMPRSLDLARPLRAAGIPVIIGGFHVSGCFAMLPTIPPELREALDLGISLFAGELEGRMDGLLQDAASGTLRPIYNYLKELPAVEGAPTPILPARLVRRTLQSLASFDAGRGCPYQCSFCTIINVQGRKSRRRSPDDIEKTVREHAAEGIKDFFITDDNFARNKDWEAIFDRLIALRECHGLNVRFMIQVDALCHRIPNFIDKAARAGVNRVFIGIESINPANLLAAKKRQNKITEYRKMLLAWKRAGCIIIAGYILGFPNDTPQSIRADLEIIKQELPIDLLEFFILTPLPGSEDHKVLWEKRAWMDEDLNRFDGEHAVSNHPRMSGQVWEDIYREAWRSYYSPEHMKTILRRGAATDSPISRLASYLLYFSQLVPVENIHPLQGGVLRRRNRLDRRPGLPIEPVWQFYPKYFWRLVSNHVRYARTWLAIDAQRRRVRKDPNRYRYTDLALTEAGEDETAALELFTHSDDARQAVEHARKIAQITGATAREPEQAPA